MPRDYSYDQGFSYERARRAGIESLWDPGSQRGATVLAIDIDTRFVEPLGGDTIEVRQLDIRTQELPERELDLVHARLLLDHQLPLPRLRLLQVVVRKPPGCRGDCRTGVA